MESKNDINYLDYYKEDNAENLIICVHGYLGGEDNNWFIEKTDLAQHLKKNGGQHVIGVNWKSKEIVRSQTDETLIANSVINNFKIMYARCISIAIQASEYLVNNFSPENQQKNNPDRRQIKQIIQVGHSLGARICSMIDQNPFKKNCKLYRALLAPATSIKDFQREQDSKRYTDEELVIFSSNHDEVLKAVFALGQSATEMPKKLDWSFIAKIGVGLLEHVVVEDSKAQGRITKDIPNTYEKITEMKSQGISLYDCSPYGHCEYTKTEPNNQNMIMNLFITLTSLKEAFVPDENQTLVQNHKPLNCEKIPGQEVAEKNSDEKNSDEKQGGFFDMVKKKTGVFGKKLNEMF